MISSTSVRSPQKICGLFDTGYAGDALDVTSQDSGSISDLFSAAATYSIDDPNEPSTSKLAFSNHMMDSWDLLEPLADLEADHLADDSLDAFVNIEKLLTGDPFFEDMAEVNPVINMAQSDMKQNINDTFLTSIFTQNSSTALTNEASSSTTANKPKKRKFPKSKSKETVIKTSMFEIQAIAEENVIVLDTQLDHDYTAKLMKLSQDSNVTNISDPDEDSVSVSCDVSLAPVKESGISDKQAVRRLKNNVASKRSREQRKQKFVEMDQEAEELIIANENLRKKIVELEKLAQEMKAKLVAKMSGK